VEAAQVKVVEGIVQVHPGPEVAAALGGEEEDAVDAERENKEKEVESTAVYRAVDYDRSDPSSAISRAPEMARRRLSLGKTAWELRDAAQHADHARRVYGPNEMARRGDLMGRYQPHQSWRERVDDEEAKEENDAEVTRVSCAVCACILCGVGHRGCQWTQCNMSRSRCSSGRWWSVSATKRPRRHARI
jgi:hypothetical protein